MDSALAPLIDDAAANPGLIVVLTGAGISAESGIPTFRGKEGYWTVGSRVYQPQELATRAAFARMPDAIWQWYLYRRTVCRAAFPNRAHAAIASAETRLADRFRLLTQNVDGLHLRAGNTPERTYQIHGNIDFFRCADGCTTALWAIPDDIGRVTREQTLSPEILARLVCPRCGGRGRPHVLWFDESYDEPLFRFESSLRAARDASLLVTVGTSGATTLPNHVVSLAIQAGAAVIDINPDDNPFGRAAERHGRGASLRGTACERLPEILDRVCATGHGC